MFDFGFSEILLIFVLALIVLGPEKLPAVVRRVGRWVGRARAMARQFQEQLEEEIDLEDRRRRPAPPDPASPEPVGESGPSETLAAHEGPEEGEPVAHAAEPPESTAPAPGAAGEAGEPAGTPGTHEPRA